MRVATTRLETAGYENPRMDVYEDRCNQKLPSIDRFHFCATSKGRWATRVAL